MVIDTTILLVSVGIYVVIYWWGKFLMYYRKTGKTVKRGNYFIIIYMNDYSYVYIFIYMIKKIGGIKSTYFIFKSIF